MSIFEAVIQGVVQGLTEFLPVSSSGHLTITQHIFGVTESNLFFDVMLHVGTLLAVLIFYHKLIWRLIKEFFRTIGAIFTGKFSWKNMDHDRRLIFMLIIGLIPLFLLFLPIPTTDLKVKDLAEILTLPKYFIFVGMALVVTSILLIIGNECSKRLKDSEKKKNFTVFDAIIVGIVQCLAAVFPGLSRSGSTLSAAQMRKIDKQEAFDYTFVISIPSIIAAAVLEFKDFSETQSLSSVDWAPVLAGVVSAMVIGFLALVLFKWLLKTNKMGIFMVYTAVVGLAVIGVSIYEMTTGVNLFTGVPIA